MDQDIKKYQASFLYKFDMDVKAIDLRTMCKNYDAVEERNGFIPLEDISKAIGVVLNRYEPVRRKYDPYKNSSITNEDNQYASHTEFVGWKDLYLWPLFQRDVSPNHVKKISLDFNPTAVITPCAIKLKVKGKAYYFVWDGHHTLQVCRMHGYTKFKIDVIDVDLVPDETVKEEGFNPSDRIAFGIWMAGQNMVRINSRNKRPLHAYDEFMIKLESKDSDTVRIHDIMTKHGVTPHRQSKGPKCLTQIKSAIECFYLTDSNGVKGRFLDRALGWHTRLWPQAPIELEMFRPMSYLYQKADIDGVILDEDWDNEMSQLVVSHYGDPETAQSKLKESYWKAVQADKPEHQGKGKLAQHDRERVLNGLLCLYHQKGGKNFKTPQPEYRWAI